MTQFPHRVLIVKLEIPYDAELEYLLDHPEQRSDEVSLEIGFAGWPARIVKDS